MLMSFEAEDPKASKNKNMFNSKRLNFADPKVSIDEEEGEGEDETLMKQYLQSKHLQQRTSSFGAFYLAQQQQQQQQAETTNNTNKSLLSTHAYCPTVTSTSTDSMSPSMLMTMVQTMPFLFPQLLMSTSNTNTITTSSPNQINPSAPEVASNQSANYETMLTSLLIQQQQQHSMMLATSKAKAATTKPTTSNNKFSIDSILNRSNHNVVGGGHAKRPRHHHHHHHHQEEQKLEPLNDNDRLIFNWLNSSTNYNNHNTDTSSITPSSMNIDMFDTLSSSISSRVGSPLNETTTISIRAPTSPAPLKAVPLSAITTTTTTNTTAPPLDRASSPSSSGKRKSLNRGPRIPFTAGQVAELEAKFAATQYLSSMEVCHLAKRLNLTDTRIRIWFQNRRAREKREHRTTTTTTTTGAEPGQPPELTKIEAEAAKVSDTNHEDNCTPLEGAAIDLSTTED